MKKTIFKSMVTALSCVLFAILFIPLASKAEELTYIPVYTTVTYTAEVPEGFSQDVILSITSEETLEITNLLLSQDRGYTETIMLLEGNYLIVSVIREGDYTTNLEEKYLLNGGDMEISFVVSEGAFEAVAENETTGESQAQEDFTYSGETVIDELTGLETADSVFSRFKETCSVMEGNPDYTSYLSVYSGALIKQHYIDESELNTEETWDAMTLTERYVRYISSSLPKVYMMNGDYKNETDFADEVSSDLVKLDNIAGGEAIKEEVINVWKWLYKYYLHTGTFYDFYASYEGPYAGTSLGGDTPGTGNSEIEEIRQVIDEAEPEVKSELEEALREELGGENVTKENGFAAWAKNNIITLVIFAIVGIALIVVMIIARKKNMQGID